MSFLKEQVLMSIFFRIQGKEKQKIHVTNGNMNNEKIDNNLLNNNKKLTSQCAPCSSAPIIILQERILTKKGMLSVNTIG